MKIPFDDIEFDPTCQLYTVTASYKGVPFTGTTYFIDENYDTYYEWTYKNGNANGRWFGVDQSSQQVINEEFYVDGERHGTSTDWFLGGAVEMVSTHERDHCVFKKRWNKDSILIIHFDERKDINAEFYDDGNVYFDTLFDGSNGFVQTYYNPGGIWLLKKIGKDRKIMGGYKNEFNEQALFRCSNSLDSTFHMEIIVQFIWFLRRERPSQVMDYLIALLDHVDTSFKAEAIIRLGEIKDATAKTHLEKKLHDQTLPYRRERFAYAGKELTNVYKIAELAQRSLNQIAGLSK